MLKIGYLWIVVQYEKKALQWRGITQSFTTLLKYFYVLQKLAILILVHMWLALTRYVFRRLIWFRDYKKFILISAEHEFFPVHKC